LGLVAGEEFVLEGEEKVAVTLEKEISLCK
jgi:hypothetical protein